MHIARVHWKSCSASILSLCACLVSLHLQEESLHWMVNNYRGQALNGRWQPRNCILGDEMGLGKTAQSIAVMSWLHQYAGAAAPCLVVAPLTTLGHWKREIETWTDLVSNRHSRAGARWAGSCKPNACRDCAGAFLLLG